MDASPSATTTEPNRRLTRKELRELLFDPPEPSRRLIRRELRDLWADPPVFCRPGASPVTDLLHWEVVIDGPDGSPYAGGTFPVDIQFVGDYSFSQPPKITFKTKVYHPNINSEGELVLDIFHHQNWSPAMRIGKLLFVVSLFYDPVLDCYPINDDIADLYESDLRQYEAEARAWTREYSSTPIVSYYPTKEDEQWLDYCDAVAAMCSADRAEERLHRRMAEERKRRAASPGRHGRRSIALLRESGVTLLWKSVVAFLQGCSARRLTIYCLSAALLLCLTIYCECRRSKLAQEEFSARGT